MLTLDIRILRSFQTVLETKSITKAAHLLGRTQPAITIQIQRLQELTGKKLFDDSQKRLTLTEDGEVVLSYAKSILRLHDELVLRLSSSDVEGHVTLGTPDLYAAYLLPPILAKFRQEFPRIQVELRCFLSAPLVKQVQNREVDLALVTRMLDFSGGEIVGKQQLAWMASENHPVHLEHPIPLALLPPGNIFRDHAIECLEGVGRQWKISCTSESISGLQAAVFGGMAVTALVKSALVPGLRELGPTEGFPPLPTVDLLLYKAAGSDSLAVDTLYRFISRHLGETLISAPG